MPGLDTGKYGNFYFINGSEGGSHWYPFLLTHRSDE